MASVGIFDRVAGLPVVQSTYGKVSEVYSCAKERNSLVNLALNTVEASLQVVSTSAQPIVHTLEKPIAHADAFACRQFDYLQETVPAIQSTPEEVVEGTKRYISEKMIEAPKRFVSETVRTGTDMVTSTPVVKLISSRVDHVLATTENVVDYILPGETGDADTTAPASTDPSVHDEATPEPAPQTPVTRLTTISHKVTDRTRALAIKQVNNAQRRAETALDQLRTNLVLISRAQEELKVQRERLLHSIDEQQARVTASSKRLLTAVQEHARSARSCASTLPNTVVSSLPETVSLPAGYVLNVDVLIDRVSQLTASTQTSLQTIAALITHMPSHLHQPINAALDQARSLHNMALEISRGNPITRAMLDQATTLITAISASTASVGTFLRTHLSSATSKKESEDLSMDDEESTEKSSKDSQVGNSHQTDEEEEDEEDGATEV